MASERRFSGAFSLVVLAVLASTVVVSATATCLPGQASTSGVIQLTESSCLPQYGSIDKNELLGMCGSAFKVDVNNKGYIYMTPLEQGQFKWAGPGPYAFPSSTNKKGFNWGVFQCKNMNATGVFNGGNKKSASVMFYTDVQGPHSQLVATGANNLTLVVSNTIGYKQPGPNCTYNFKVVSGCVMGIQSSSPYSCPSGWYIKTNTKYNTKYCAPCPLGTTSSGPGATKCIPCAAGYAGFQVGGGCKKCDGNTYSSKPGATQCSFCSVSYWKFDSKAVRKYTDGKSCKTCPPDSWALDSNPSQCVACNNGVKCCRTNPSKDCPPCQPGFKSGSTTKPATFVLTSAQPTSCLKTDAAICAASFTVTVLPTCQVEYQKYTPVAGSPCFDTLSNGTAEVLKSKASIYDVPLFDFAAGPPYVSSVSGPLVTFKLPAEAFTTSADPKACKFTYRSVSTAGSLLGASPAPCPADKPGCLTKAKPHVCPAGYHVSKNIDGNTLCLPCPAGSYAKSPNSNTQCTLCPAGKYAPGYGSTSCGSCPIGTYSEKGAAECTECTLSSSPQEPSNPSGYYSSKAGSSACKPCPPNTAAQGSASFPGRFSRCLGHIGGRVCCAAGDCSGQPACPKKIPAYRQADAAIFQLLSKQLTDSSCQNATILKCLSTNGLLSLKPSESAASISVDPYNQPRCVENNYGYFTALQLGGVYDAANHAKFITLPADSTNTYEAVSNARTGTIKVYYGLPDNDSGALDLSKTKCTATFKLIAGYAFDLKPPKGAKCPAGSKPISHSGSVSCHSCDPGSILKNDKCQRCPAGTYQPVVGGGKCYSCPIGTISDAGSGYCYTCSAGSVPKGLNKCVDCGANTYASVGSPKCKACPAGLVSPTQSSACGVPFPKK